MSDSNKPIGYGLPEAFRVKRGYTMSEAALKARRENAQKSTGPTTEEGKATSSRNAWKHGLYAQSFVFGTLGKPCKSTCHKKEECTLLRDGVVEVGETCLDRQYMAEAFDAVAKSIQNGDHSDFQGLAAIEMAGAIDILRAMKEAILEDGVIVKSQKSDKDGNVIGYEYKPHPCLAQYQKMLTDFNFTPGDFLITPKEIAKAEKDKDEDKEDNIATIMARAQEKLIDKIK